MTIEEEGYHDIHPKYYFQLQLILIASFKAVKCNLVFPILCFFIATQLYHFPYFQSLFQLIKIDFHWLIFLKGGNFKEFPFNWT